MGGKSITIRPKQDRVMRTKWNPALDKIFADLVVEQIQLGNRPNDVFDKKTWNHIRDEFNKQTDLNFNSNQLRKHLHVLQTRFLGIKSSVYSNDNNEFLIDDSGGIDFEVWDEDYEAQPQGEPIKANECPIFEQLSTIFAESGANGKLGKYAQSSHYAEVDKSPKTELKKLLPNTGNLLVNSDTTMVDLHAHPISSSFATPIAPSDPHATKGITDRKRKRNPEEYIAPIQARNDQDPNEKMAKAMMDMLNASTLRRKSKPEQEDKFTITKCIEILDEIEGEGGMDSKTYFTALDLFDNPNMREMFVSLKSNKIRLAWLRGKCGNKTKSS